MSGDHVAIPFEHVKYFVFLKGQVNGTAGRFIFDTGTREALALNDHFIPLTGGNVLPTKGKVGSGQTYTRTIYSCLSSVELSGQASELSIANVEGNNLDFIERDLVPDFLGFIGYDSFAGYAVKMDYDKGILDFYRAGTTTDGKPSFLKGETVVGVLPFEIRKRPNDPFIKVKFGGEEFVAGFDTGQLGTLEMPDALRDTLIARKALTALPDKDEDGKVVYKLNRVQLTSNIEVTIPALPIEHPGGPGDVGTGVTEDHSMTFGYGFLTQFKTVWDFPEQKIFLLARSPL